MIEVLCWIGTAKETSFIKVLFLKIVIIFIKDDDFIFIGLLVIFRITMMAIDD